MATLWVYICIEGEKPLKLRHKIAFNLPKTHTKGNKELSSGEKFLW